MTDVNNGSPQRSYRFYDDDKLIIRKIDYQPVSWSKKGLTARRMDGSGAIESFTTEQIAAMLDDPLQPFERVSHFYGSQRAKNRLNGRETLNALPFQWQARNMGRTMWVEALLHAKVERDQERFDARRKGIRPLPPKISLSADSLRPVIDRLERDLRRRYEELFTPGARVHKRGKADNEEAIELFIPKPRTLNDWFTKYHSADKDQMALTDSYEARNYQYFTADENVHIAAGLRQYLSRLLTKPVDVHGFIEGKIKDANKTRPEGEKLRVPDYETIRKRIAAMPQAIADGARLGSDAAAALHQATGRGLDIIRPLELVQMDEWKTDLHVLLAVVGVWEKLSQKERRKIKRVRLWITAAICVATRCIVGLKVSVSSPGINSALAALEMITVDKTPLARSLGCLSDWPMRGTPEEVAVDSAAWYASRIFAVALNSLSTTIFLPSAGQPSLRGYVERLFLTLSTQALPFFTGRTFSSPDEKGNYDSEEQASVLAQTLAVCITRFVVDCYHNTSHKGLNDEIPGLRWRRLAAEHGVLPEPTGDERRAVFGITTYRKVTRHGVLIAGLPYNSRQLADIYRKSPHSEVRCKVHPADLGFISVWTAKGWIKVPGVFEEFVGVSLVQWVAACQMLRLFNRKNAEAQRHIVLETFAYLRQQGEISRIQAELASPIADDYTLERFEKRLNYAFGFSDKAVTPQLDLRSEWTASKEFFDILGIEPVVYKEDDVKTSSKKPKARSRLAQGDVQSPNLSHPPEERERPRFSDLFDD